MRIRTVKPEFFSHEGMAGLPPHARLLAIGLLMLADCEGRLRWIAVQVHAAIFPFEPDIPLEALREALRELGFLKSYSVDGKQYVSITNFRKHQRLQGREAAEPSKLPPPPEIEENSVATSSDSKSCVPEYGTYSQNDSAGSVVICPERERERERERNIASRIPKESKEAEPSILVFPCSGTTKFWNLTQSKIDEWSACFPSVEILSECRKALAWCNANPSKRKTSRGMPNFLVKWFSRVQDRGGPIPMNSHRPAQRDPDGIVRGFIHPEVTVDTADYAPYKD